MAANKPGKPSCATDGATDTSAKLEMAYIELEDERDVIPVWVDSHNPVDLSLIAATIDHMPIAHPSCILMGGAASLLNTDYKTNEGRCTWSDLRKRLRVRACCISPGIIMWHAP